MLWVVVEGRWWSLLMQARLGRGCQVGLVRRPVPLLGGPDAGTTPQRAGRRYSSAALAGALRGAPDAAAGKQGGEGGGVPDTTACCILWTEQAIGGLKLRLRHGWSFAIEEGERMRCGC